MRLLIQIASATVSPATVPLRIIMIQPLTLSN